MAGDLFCWPCACVFVLCEHMAFVLVFCVPCALMQGRAETFGGAGAQSIKEAHGTRRLIGLCSLLICVSKWMLLYYTAANAMTQVSKRNRTEKTILSLNVKDIFCTS